MPATNCTGGAQGTPGWGNATHHYSISSEKMERLSLALPTDTTQWEAFFKKHADRIVEREQNVPIVQVGDFNKSAPFARLEDGSK